MVHKHWVGPSNLVKCKPCPAAQSAMVCGSDGHTYTSKVSFLHCLFFFFVIKKYSVSARSDKALWAEMGPCESRWTWSLVFDKLPQE